MPCGILGAQNEADIMMFASFFFYLPNQMDTGIICADCGLIDV
jgi:hypothetical protein